MAVGPGWFPKFENCTSNLEVARIRYTFALVHTPAQQKSQSNSTSSKQVNGKLLVATAGGSSQKPSAIALLEVNSVDDLLESEPEQWQSIRLSTKSEVWCTKLVKWFPILHGITWS